jgi:hypothetical protein
MYLVPQAKIFDNIFMCFRLWGTCLLLILGLIVMAGVRVVNKFALPTIGLVFACIGCTFIGGVYNFYGSDRLKSVDKRVRMHKHTTTDSV